jgi:hypothetical protein
LEDINNKKNKPPWSTILNTAILAIAIIAIITANLSNKEMQVLTQQSVDSAVESARISNDALNETRKLVEWTKPEPNIIVDSNIKWLGRNGTIDLKISSYSPNKGVKDSFIQPKPLEILIFNSGKAPVAFATMYIRFNLTDVNKTYDVFPFKLSKVDTLIDKFYYDTINEELVQPYEQKYPFELKTEITYRHRNEKGVFGFPPSIIYGEVVFTELIQTYGSIYFERDWDNYIGSYRIGRFGPFRIGNIESGETKNVDIEVFAVVEDFWKELTDDPTYTTEQKIYASGNLIIEFEAANYEKVIYEYPLRSFFHYPY